MASSYPPATNRPYTQTKPKQPINEDATGETELIESTKSCGSNHNGHCHTDLTAARGMDKRARKKLVIASILCLLFTIGEAVGGIMAGSLAIATDSAHMLTDFASFMISLLALFLASRPATKRLSFGWHRAEIIGALVSVQLIWLVTGVLVYMAVQRCIDTSYTIEPITMMITAATAVFVNILLGLTLHGVGHNHSHFGSSHSHTAAHNTSSDDRRSLLDNQISTAYGSVADEEDLRVDIHHSHRSENINVKAALIHVIGDLIQSIGVLIASVIIYFGDGTEGQPDYKIADPICTFIFSVLVLISTVKIFKEAVSVLMEAAPSHINFSDLKEALMEIDSVRYVHNLRIWSLTTTRVTMSVHLAIADEKRYQCVLQESCRIIIKRFGIEDPTVQIELYSDEMEDCSHCKDPQ